MTMRRCVLFVATFLASQVALAHHGLFADGTRMDRYGQYVKAPQGGLQEVRGPIVTPKTNRPPRRPTGEPNISGDWAPEQVVMANPRGTGGGMVRLTQLSEYKPDERG